MIDIGKVTYRLVVMTESGQQYNITEYVENLGWEENERELALRISFTAKNENTNVGKISSFVKLGCLVGIFAASDSQYEEVARGYVTEWKPTWNGSSSSFQVVCYDELYNLQESQDNVYFSAGISTQSAILQICDDWEIPLGDYQGPDATHGKLAYRSENLSDILLDILDDGKKKTGISSMLRAKEGIIHVVEWGSNEAVFHFSSDNTILASHKMSTSGMVTRVKVIGQEDNDGRSSVEASLDGLTQYGVRQKIYIRGSDDSLEDAKSAAQDILNEKGIIQEDITVQSPDVPSIRKGDLVHLAIGTMEGYYFVKGIRHDADTGNMNMELKHTEAE